MSQGVPISSQIPQSIQRSERLERIEQTASPGKDEKELT